MDPYTWFSAPGDMATFKWIDIFVEASFYPIFAILFGYGLNMQYEKSMANKMPFAPVMARRMGILLGIRLASCIVHLDGGHFIHIRVNGLYDDCIC